MSFVGVAIGGSAVLGAGASLYAANKQSDAAGNALALQKQMFDTSQKNLNPFIQAGQGATYTLGQLTGSGGNNPTGNPNYSSFFTDPSYQFTLGQGMRGITNFANSQGVGLSGGTLKDIGEFTGGLASQQYGNYFNRLMGLSTMGANAAAGQATNATNASGQIGNTMMGQGQAQASGIVGATNALNGGVSNSLMANYISKMNPSAYQGAGGLGGGINGSTSSIGIGGGYQMPVYS